MLRNGKILDAVKEHFQLNVETWWLSLQLRIREYRIRHSAELLVTLAVSLRACTEVQATQVSTLCNDSVNIFPVNEDSTKFSTDTDKQPTVSMDTRSTL
jgi:hypothetical protein